MNGRPKSGSIVQRAKKKWDIVWTNYTMTRQKRRYRRHRGTPDRRAAYVVGCQRSGTNMLIQTLDRCMDVDRFDESDPRAFDDCRIKGPAVQQALCAKSNAQCVIFKPVCDCHRVTELLAEMPGSKAAWIYRQYHDVANSAVERWGDVTQQWVEDLLGGGGDWGSRQWNREKVTDECLAEVRQACADGLSPHGAAALFWYMRNRTFFEQDLEHHSDVILTRYEHVVATPAPEIARICRFLQVGFDPGMVRKIHARSVRKQDFPDVSPRITELCDAMMDRLDRVRAAAD